MDINYNNIAFQRSATELGFREKQAPRGTKYIADGKAEVANRTLIRYAKDYSAYGLGFTLFVRTFYENRADVEKQLDTVADKLTKKKLLELNASEDFVYLNINLEEK